jgi:hypothetical protein
VLFGRIDAVFNNGRFIMKPGSVELFLNRISIYFMWLMIDSARENKLEKNI